MKLYRCGDVAVVRANDQITFPVTRDGTIFDLRRAFTDRDRTLDLA